MRFALAGCEAEADEVLTGEVWAPDFFATGLAALLELLGFPGLVEAEPSVPASSTAHPRLANFPNDVALRPTSKTPGALRWSAEKTEPVPRMMLRDGHGNDG